MEREAIGNLKPSGWHTVKYDGISGIYLYNRCHLIGYQLGGDNANYNNLITGTRYLNVEGALPFENRVADYLEKTGNHVIYRITPVFEGSNLLANGILMEAYSVEDSGGLQFCRYCYNVQPGIEINYADGSSSGPEYTGNTTAETTPANTDMEKTGGESEQNTYDYVINLNSGKIHLPSCGSVTNMKESNKYYFHGTYEETLSLSGKNSPCGNCHPEKTANQ